LFARPAAADPLSSTITGTVTALPDGRYQYDYTITNLDDRVGPDISTPTSQVIFFDLGVPRYTTPDGSQLIGWPQSVSAPPGWAWEGPCCCSPAGGQGRRGEP